MAKIVELPDGREAEFPDDMSNDAIGAVLSKQFGSPAPQQTEPTNTPDSFLSRVGTGLADPIVGAGQIADRYLVNPIRQVIAPGASSMEDVTRQRDAEYNAPEGVDWARMGGNVANPVNWLGASAPIRAGAIQAMTQPVNPNEDFLTEKAKQAGIGAAGGGLSRALGFIRAGAKPTEEALAFQAKMQHVRGGEPPPANLTPGQLAPEGGWLRKLEQGVADVPFVGAPLRSRHDDAMRGYQEWSRHLAAPPQAGDESVKTIAGIKTAFNDAYEGALANKTVMMPTSMGPQQVNAHSAHLYETELKSEAGKLLKSPDPMHRMEGARKMEEASILGKQWRSQLAPSDQAELQAIDKSYANFVPIKEASKRQNATLVNPEAYTPQIVLKRSRGIPNNEQAKFARQAEQSIGSIPSRPTTAGTIGLGGLGLGSLLMGQGPLAAGTAVAALAYGTKPGQVAARGVQNALTNDKLAAVIDALRRGTIANAARTGTTENGND